MSIVDTYMKPIIFDFDGPLADSFESDLAYQQEAFGLTYADAKQRSVEYHMQKPDRDMSKDDALQKLLSTTVWNLNMISGGAKLRPQAIQAIQYLREYAHLGVISNGTTEYIRTLFGKHWSDSRTDYMISLGIWGRDTHHHHKADRLLELCKVHGIVPSQCIYVTDTVNDYHALVGEKVLVADQLFVALYGGIHTHEHWKTFAADHPDTHLIHTPEDLVIKLIPTLKSPHGQIQP